MLNIHCLIGYTLIKTYVANSYTETHYLQCSIGDVIYAIAHITQYKRLNYLMKMGCFPIILTMG